MKVTFHLYCEAIKLDLVYFDIDLPVLPQVKDDINFHGLNRDADFYVMNHGEKEVVCSLITVDPYFKKTFGHEFNELFWTVLQRRLFFEENEMQCEIMLEGEL